MRSSQIQGLRGLAVLLVLLNHLDISIFDNGFIGVDIFFVISGFVITKNLMNELNRTNTIVVPEFYVKRFRRLIPNLSFMILVVTIFSIFLSSPLGQQQDIAKSAVAGLFGLSNFYFMIAGSDYFNSLETNPLIHTWSLAVELQFYLVYPLVVRWAFRNRDNRYLGKIFFALIFASIIYTIITLKFLSPYIQDMNFYDPLSRVWEFVLGGLVFLINQISKFRVFTINLSGFLLILFLLLVIPNSSLEIGFIIRLFACIGTLLILNNNKPSHDFKFLTNKIMVKLGDLSYSIYLWHFPFIIFSTHIFENEIISKTLALILLTFFSYISYKYIEFPFHQGKFKKVKLSRIMSLFIIIPSVLALGLGLTAKVLLYPKFNQPGIFLFSGQVGNTNKPINDYSDYINCEFQSLGLLCPKIDKEMGVIFVVGDSHAGSLVGTISSSTNSQVAFVHTKSLTDARFQDDLLKLQEHLGSYKQKHILLIANWDNSGPSRQLPSFLKFLEDQSINVYVFEDNPNFSFDAFTCAYGLSVFVRSNKCSEKIDTDAKINNLINSFQKNTYVPVKKYFCKKDICSMTFQNKILFFDNHHLNLNGAKFLVEELSTVIQLFKTDNVIRSDKNDS